MFVTFGFRVISRRGSHVKLVRETPSGRQVLTVPAHPELDTGTLRAFVRQASRFIAPDEPHPHFHR